MAIGVPEALWLGVCQNASSARWMRTSPEVLNRRIAARRDGRSGNRVERARRRETNARLQGWAFADQGLRVAAGYPPLPDIGIKDRLFTADNINSIDLNAEESTWYGEGDYKAAYEKLWGVK